MKRVLKIVFLLTIIVVLPVYASSGALRRSSIKTCPNGKTYGQHSENKVLHWHEAESHPEMSSGWAAIGDPLPGDPCPNAGTDATTTTKKTTTTTTTTRTYITTTKVTSTTSKEIIPVVPVTTTTVVEPTTESTTTIETTTTTSSTTTTTKKYNPSVGLKANGISISLSDKKGNANLLYWDDKVKFEVNSFYSIKIFDGDKEIENSFDYVEDKEYKLEIYSENELIDTYNIYVKKHGLFFTIACVIFSICAVASIPTVIVLIINHHKKYGKVR